MRVVAIFQDGGGELEIDFNKCQTIQGVRTWLNNTDKWISVGANIILNSEKITMFKEVESDTSNIKTN